MRKILVTIFILTFNISSVNAEEAKCDTVREKANPACSKILQDAGKGMGGLFKKMTNFSKKHETIGKSLGIEEKKGEDGKKKAFNLKEFSKKHKTVNDTVDVIKKKK
tara:strand:- start:3800 stop:4120 length:321 start_codon:yes stop_codon:yes gene_type:complete